MKLSQRFGLLLAVLVAGLLTYGYWSFKTLNELKINGPLYERIIQGKDLIADVLPPPEYVIESYLTALELASASPAERQPLVDQLARLRKEYEDRHQYWTAAALDPATAAQLLGKVHQPASEFYDRAFQRFLPALARNDNAAADAELAAMKRSYAAHRAAVNTLVQMVNQRNQADEASARAQIALASSVMFAILLLVSAACLLACALLARNLIRQVGGEPTYATEIAHQIATGDLTAPIALARGDQHSIIYAIKSMRDSLRNIVGQVRSGTETVAAASVQIASGNHDLSVRTEQQASALEEAAAAMEELASTVRQNGAHARQANELALAASAVAEQGGAVVARVVETMGSLNDSSRHIVEIIDVIDAIAFQTNILALNAAVEAARAGEQGRGFAVVAAEVRSLAQRSAAAARQIKQLITESVDKIRVGNEMVDQAGSTMREILGSVRKVTAIMGEIASAGREQEAGIGQISQTVSHMDAATQQNAALVEQAAAASQALRDQAHALERAVSVFQLEGRALPARPAALALAA